jgi:transposase
MDADERMMFRNYSAALRLWARRYNTAEIAAVLNVHESCVCRWIWHWRELSRA